MFIVVMAVLLAGWPSIQSPSQGVGGDIAVALPRPRTSGAVPLEEALRRRRSVRSYRPEPLTLAEAGQLLWAAQGVTGVEGQRTAPSAGALYPLEIYLVTGSVEGLAPGVYRYRPPRHDLLPTATGDRRADLAAAAGHQAWVRSAAAVLVVAGVYRRTAVKYGPRADRYVHMEVGAVAENVYLQATAQGLGTVAVGAFADHEVRRLLDLPESEAPLLLMPVGRPRR